MTTNDSGISEDSKEEPSEKSIPYRLVAKRYIMKVMIRQDELTFDQMAYDREMDRNVSIKVIPNELVDDSKLMRRLKQQSDQALMLGHEHIVRLFSVDTWKDLTYAVTEYIPGHTLAGLLSEKGGKLPLDTALLLLRQIAAALDFAHAKNPAMIHGDLKPVNVLLTEEGRAKIADFGLAAVMGDFAVRKLPRKDARTFAYKAPEQMIGKNIGPWTDIYALAAIAYEMLSGRPPFDEGDIRSKIIREEVKRIEGLPALMNNALLAGLAKNRSNRPQTATDFVDMLAGEMPVPEIEDEEKLAKREEKPLADGLQEDPRPILQKTAAGPGGGRSRKVLGVLLLLGLFCLGGALAWMFMQKVGKQETTQKIPIVKPVQPKTVVEKPKPQPPPSESHPVPKPAVPTPPQKQNAPVAKKINRPVLGELLVRTDPPGADIYLDGQKRGPTPLVIKDLKVGSHSLALEKKGYEVLREQVDIKALERIAFKKTLKAVVRGVVVTSIPPGADVYVDNALKGKTPVTLEGVNPGKRLFTLKKDGYKDWSREFMVQAGQNSDLVAELVSAAGGLKISSKPKGARVYLDGKSKGKTPLVLKDITVGAHKIAVKQAGYNKWEKDVDIAAGELKKLDVDLEAKLGNLRITSEPSKANVFQSGKLVGETPLDLKALTPGKITLEVKKNCYANSNHVVSIVAGESIETNVKLTSTCGNLMVDAKPNGAKWVLNGKKMGRLPGKADNLPKGKYEIQVIKEKFEVWAAVVNVEPDNTVRVNAELKKALPNLGDTFEDPVTGLTFEYVPGGCFDMGSPASELGRNFDEGPVRSVCLDGFWMSQLEVTQGAWQRVTGQNPAFFTKGSDYPVENIRWNDAQAFIKALNAKSKTPSFRLPTEAEWEYACRSGGREELYAGGVQVGLAAWYKGNSYRTIHPTGKRTPNGLKLYDMSGNAAEWVEDVYAADAYQKGAKNNPVNTEGGTDRVARGGSWNQPDKECRCASRNYFAPDHKNYWLGLRLVRDL